MNKPTPAHDVAHTLLEAINAHRHGIGFDITRYDERLKPLGVVLVEYQGALHLMTHRAPNVNLELAHAAHRTD
jgi:hypothetical protein